MKKFICSFVLLLFFFILASFTIAAWKFNPYTHKQDYYESGITSAQIGAAYDTEAELDALFAAKEPLLTIDSIDAITEIAAGIKAGGSDAVKIVTSGTISTTDAIVTIDANDNVTENTNVLIDSDGVVNLGTSPGIEFLDSDGAGAELADKLVCEFFSNFTTTTEDAEYGDIWLTCVINGTHTEIIRYDASDGKWETTQPIDSSAAIEAGGIDAGIENVWNNTALDFDTTYPGQCHIIIYSEGTTAREYTLPDDVMCSTGYGKIVHIIVRANKALTLAPGTGDYFCLAGDLNCESINEKIDVTAVRGSAIHLVGTDYSGTQYWMSTPGLQVGTWTGE